ncbi:MAG: helix-turn-helix domain-containing protein [Treponema sp.]|nr:helix-turn-helix domain-containing protein [Treponema sp.]
MDEKNLKRILGENIKFFRLRRQFSQAELAEKANISVTFLSNIERGNNYPQAGTISSISNALGMEVWELFKNDDAFNEQNAIIDRVSEDFIKHVTIALETVHKKYKTN